MKSDGSQRDIRRAGVIQHPHTGGIVVQGEPDHASGLVPECRIIMDSDLIVSGRKHAEANVIVFVVLTAADTPFQIGKMAGHVLARVDIADILGCLRGIVQLDIVRDQLGMVCDFEFIPGRRCSDKRIHALVRPRGDVIGAEGCTTGGSLVVDA